MGIVEFGLTDGTIYDAGKISRPIILINKIFSQFWGRGVYQHR